MLRSMKSVKNSARDGGNPKKVWRWFDVPLIFVVTILIIAALLSAWESWTGSEAGEDLLALFIGAGLGAGVLIGALWRHVGLRELGFRGAQTRWWRLALLMAALWVPLRTLSVLSEPFSWMVLSHVRFQDAALNVLAVLVFAPLGEELFYRGVIYRWLRQLMPFGFALILSAFLFTAAHWSGYPVHLGLVFASGLLYAWFFERSGSLLPGMLIHALVNLVASLLTLGH